MQHRKQQICFLQRMDGEFFSLHNFSQAPDLVQSNVNFFTKIEKNNHYFTQPSNSFNDQ